MILENIVTFIGVLVGLFGFALAVHSFVSNAKDQRQWRAYITDKIERMENQNK